MERMDSINGASGEFTDQLTPSSKVKCGHHRVDAETSRDEMLLKKLVFKPNEL